MSIKDYKERLKKLIQRIENSIANGRVDEKVDKAILKNFTVESKDKNMENSMIQEDYVSFETAKLLNEKGFDVHIYAYYEDEDNPNISLYGGKAINWNKTEFISKPTLQTAMKWLREVHNIFISIVFCTYPTEKRVTWTPEISTFDSVFPESAIEYDSYEQACEEAIKYCLTNLI